AAPAHRRHERSPLPRFPAQERQRGRSRGRARARLLGAAAALSEFFHQTQPLSSPRRRGPITTKVSRYFWPCHNSLCCGGWVPACAGTTAESHCFTSSKRIQGHVLRSLF